MHKIDKEPPKVAFDRIKQNAKETVAAEEDGRKRVLIIKGGPSTGKTVLAINLMAWACKELDGMSCYTSQNAAPRNTYLSLRNTLKRQRET